MDREELNQLAESIANLRRQKVWMRSLAQRVEETRANSHRLHQQLRSEQKDVERLEHSALTRFVLTMFDEEKMEREQHEAAEALVRWQQADAETRTLEAELARTTAQVRELDESEQRYQQALQHHTRNLLHGPVELAEKLKQKIGEEEALRNRLQLVQRAVGSANAAHERLRVAADKIGSARSWGKFDVWGGGSALSSHVKRSRIDEAADAVLEAQIHIDSLRMELQELGEPASFPTISTEVGHRMMDVFLDNIFTDIKVQRRVEEIQSSVDQVLQAVDSRGADLVRMLADTRRELDEAVASREQYVREAAR